MVKHWKRCVRVSDGHRIEPDADYAAGFASAEFSMNESLALAW
jgi:hypothetical protein